MHPGTTADRQAGTIHSVIGASSGAVVTACGFSIAQANRIAGEPLKGGRNHGGPCKFVVSAVRPTGDGLRKTYPGIDIENGKFSPLVERSSHPWIVDRGLISR